MLTSQPFSLPGLRRGAGQGPPTCTRLLFSAGFSATYDSSHGARSSAEQSITRLNALTINCGCSALHHSPLRLSRVSSTSNLKNTCTLQKHLVRPGPASLSLSLSCLHLSLALSFTRSCLESTKGASKYILFACPKNSCLAATAREGFWKLVLDGCCSCIHDLGTHFCTSCR